MRRFFVALAANFVFDAALAMVVFTMAYEGGVTWAGLTTSATTLFGGIGGLVGWAVGLAVFVGLLMWHNRMSRGGNHDGATALMAIAVIVAGFGIWRLLKLPDSQVMTLAAMLVAVTVQTLIVWLILTGRPMPGWNRFRAWRQRRRAAAPATPAPAGPAPTGPATP